MCIPPCHQPFVYTTEHHAAPPASHLPQLPSKLAGECFVVLRAGASPVEASPRGNEEGLGSGHGVSVRASDTTSDCSLAEHTHHLGLPLVCQLRNLTSAPHRVVADRLLQCWGLSLSCRSLTRHHCYPPAGPRWNWSRLYRCCWRHCRRHHGQLQEQEPRG